MKRCPECRRDYFDETLNFCLDDGSRLVSGPFTGPLEATAIYPFVQGPFESGTRIFGESREWTPKAPANTIAILPFLNLSSNDEGDYFSDGLAEELLNVLSKIRQLRVAARTSSFSFKGKQMTVSEIGRVLNVASVLEGSFRKAGARVRISVQLVKVEDGYQLWSETYDRTMDDIFAVQDDIARSVVEEIRVRLLGEKPGDRVSREVDSDVAKAMIGHSANPEAHRLMMLGRYFLDRTTREDTEKAVSYFKQALELDADFALCWAELARAYAVEAGSGWRPLVEAFDLARGAVGHSLRLVPDLAEGHAQMGRIQAAYDQDLGEAEQSYRRALELAPGSPSVLDGASILAYKMGRLDEAIALSKKVLERDPLSAAFWHNLGLTCNAAGRLDESEKAFRRSLDIAPQRHVTRALLSLVLLDDSRLQEAIEAAESEPDEFWRSWALAIIYSTAGRNDESDKLLDTIIAERADGNQYQIAEICAMRGETDAAFDWLERARLERDPGVTHAGVDPRLRSLHQDARWTDLMAEIGLSGQRSDRHVS